MADSWRQINFLEGQGHRIELGVRWQAFIHFSPMRRTKDSKTVSGTGLRGGIVEDVVDGYSIVENHQLTMARQEPARRTAILCQ